MVRNRWQIPHLFRLLPINYCLFMFMGVSNSMFRIIERKIPSPFPIILIITHRCMKILLRESFKIPIIGRYVNELNKKLWFKTYHISSMKKKSNIKPNSNDWTFFQNINVWHYSGFIHHSRYLKLTALYVY